MQNELHHIKFYSVFFSLVGAKGGATFSTTGGLEVSAFGVSVVGADFTALAPLL